MDCNRTQLSQAQAEDRDAVAPGTYDYVSDKAAEVRRSSGRRG